MLATELKDKLIAGWTEELALVTTWLGLSERMDAAGHKVWIVRNDRGRLCIRFDANERGDIRAVCTTHPQAATAYLDRLEAIQMANRVTNGFGERAHSVLRTRALRDTIHDLTELIAAADE